MLWQLSLRKQAVMPASSILAFSWWSEIVGEKTNVNMWLAKTECHIVILQEESSLFVVHFKEFHNTMHDTKSNLSPALGAQPFLVSQPWHKETNMRPNQTKCRPLAFLA